MLINGFVQGVFDENLSEMRPSRIDDEMPNSTRTIAFSSEYSILFSGNVDTKKTGRKA